MEYSKFRQFVESKACRRISTFGRVLTFSSLLGACLWSRPLLTLGNDGECAPKVLQALQEALSTASYYRISSARSFFVNHPGVESRGGFGRRILEARELLNRGQIDRAYSALRDVASEMYDQGRLQEAAFFFFQIGMTRRAQEVEREILQAVSTHSPVQVGMAGHLPILQFGNVRMVFKGDETTRSRGAGHEVAAYVLDRMFGFHYVPVTAPLSIQR